MSADYRVNAIVPLSLLQALRNLDTPVEDGLQEVAEETVTRRLGLSATVAAQIQRYEEMAGRGLLLPREEAVSVFRLVDRRPDASLVFADGGRRAARQAVRGSRFSVRRLAGTSSGIGRRVGFRSARKLAERVFRGNLSLEHRSARALVPEPLGLLLEAGSRSCAFYGAAFAELLRLLTGFEGAMLHRTCRLKGGEVCSWEATHIEEDG